jgi:hypothetical protein
MNIALNAQRRLVRFSFTEVVVIESLGSRDMSTGRELAAYVSTLDSFVARGIPITLRNCQTASDLRCLFASLALDAALKGNCPLLHIECHGSASGNGLVLTNGDTVSWAELTPMLKALNIATKFNLLVFLAACNAFYFIEEMTSMHPSPVYALVAPSDEIDPGEVMRGTRVYYRILFDTGDAGVALRWLRAERLAAGRWFGKTAEEWFEEVIVNYVHSQCSKKAIAERARMLYQSQGHTSNRRSVGKLKRELGQRHAVFVRKYFQEFFCTEEVPDNLSRFDKLKRRVESKVNSMLAAPGFR